jgi:hypothetical protein
MKLYFLLAFICTTFMVWPGANNQSDYNTVPDIQKFVWMDQIFILLVHLDQRSMCIIGPGSHVEYPTGTKNSNFVEDHPRNILAKFGSNWPSGFGEEA